MKQLKMETRCTITIPVAEEQALLDAVKNISSREGDITAKRVGPANAVSQAMHTDCIYYDIYLKGGNNEDPWLSTAIFQLGQWTAYSLLTIKANDLLNGG